MKKIPTDIVIQGKPYTITELPAVSLSDDFGRCNSRELSIQIARNQAPAQLRDTLLHEVIHALSFELHLDLEERQVHVLASG
ncbi:MAG: SprT-like domain-containing protein, partial [Nitrospira sp.]|nr:SprT-like domain-containing protein [Nitrospira sp.]